MTDKVSKKIAVMTWFHYHNYGTALQAIALRHVIKSDGYRVDNINYIPDGKVTSLSRNAFSWYLRKMKNISLAVLNNRRCHDKKRDERFEEFISQHLTLTPACASSIDFESLNDEYGAFVCGSDQIWAPSCFDPKYFMDFVKNNRKKVAYAPSIGLSSISDRYIKSRMAELIKSFHHLSVREEQGADLIFDLCDKRSEVVLDPTLLLTAAEWDELLPPTPEVDASPYILCYFLGANVRHWKKVEQISKALKMRVKVIPIFTKDLNKGYEIAGGVGPKEFLDLIRKAYFVCTDSFHGTAFSILYNKPFCVFERFLNNDPISQNSRIYNILNLTGLCDRLDIDVTKNLMSTNWKQVDASVETARIKSKEYLSTALADAVNAPELKSIFPLTQNCCGCGGCTAVCGCGALQIKENKGGFLTPYYTENLCVQCGRCHEICPMRVSNKKIILAPEQRLYSLKSFDYAVLKGSSSGGAAYELASMFFEKGYDVVGCAYNIEKELAEHMVVSPATSTVDMIKIFQGSKYIQSDFSQAFDEIMDDTPKRAIVFGTPCQIAAFDNIAKRYNRRSNFILVDLICHGVPSHNLLLKYFEYIERIHKIARPHKILFRDKSKGWRERYIYNGNLRKGISIHQDKDLFFRFFENGHCYSRSCYECPYRDASSADIRIGDYWGSRFKKDKTGVSMLLTITNAGENTIVELAASGRVDVKQHLGKEYSNSQQMVNFKRPVFYEELMAELGDASIALEEISEKYGREFDVRHKINKKLRAPYVVIKNIYKKMRNR